MLTEKSPPVENAAPLLQVFGDFLALHTGWHFGEDRWPDLMRGMNALAPELNFPSGEACMRSLMRAPFGRREVESVARHFAVGETYFFRDPEMFAVLEQDILPRLIEARRTNGKRLRIWSAGCCTGEEAYSMAIAIGKLIPNLDGWDITILGTDIHPGFVATARLGVYRDWSFRGVPEAIRRHNFDKTEAGGYAIKPRLRQLVRFECLNLMNEVYTPLDGCVGSIDIILCRNVLMYFGRAQIGRVIGKLRHALMDGGWLIVSASELGAQLFADFSTVNFPDATLYRKPGGSASFVAAHTAADPGASSVGVRQVQKKPERIAPGAILRPYDSALALFEAGAYQQAVSILLSGDRRGARELALLARAQANQGHLQEACRWCAAAVAADKCNPALRYLQALILEEMGCGQRAKTALLGALYLDQNFVLAHYALGNLCRRLGDRVSAARHFKHALDLLHDHQAADILPESEGLAAARLIEMIRAREGAT